MTLKKKKRSESILLLDQFKKNAKLPVIEIISGAILILEIQKEFRSSLFINLKSQIIMICWMLVLKLNVSNLICIQMALTIFVHYDKITIEKARLKYYGN